MEYSKSQLAFLDILIFKRDKIIKTNRFYTKLTVLLIPSQTNEEKYFSLI